MTTPLRIAVVGYGVAGIAVAIHLRRLGHAIEHFERNPDVRASGAGLLLQPPTLRLLDEIGLGAAELRHGARVNGFGAQTLEGRVLTSIRYADHAPGRHALGIQRRYLVKRMQQLDSGREQVHFSHAVIGVDEPRGMLLLDDGGQRGPFDMIIAADGARSGLRGGCPHLLRHDRLYSSAALVTCIDDPEGIAGEQLIQYFDGPRHIAVWPVGAAGDAQPRRLNLSISIPLDQAGAFRACGEWRAMAARHCPAIAPLLVRSGMDPEPLIYAYRDVSLRRFVSGRLVFIGDAAHSMSPLLGQGARLALLDASNLAKALRSHGNVAAALHVFDRDARAQAADFQRISRWLTPVFQSESRLLAAVRHSAQLAHRMPFIAAKVRTTLIG